MQILESIISFLVLLSFSIFLLLASDTRIDDSLYLYELQGDARNVIHLKGGFENKIIGNDAAMEIYDLTGLCIEMSQTDITSYRVDAGNAVSGEIRIPHLKSGNLTGFVQDRLLFGSCANG